MLNNLAWTAQFIDQYQDYLEANNASLVVTFSKARLEFAKKNYTEALNLLNGIIGAPLNLDIRIKSLSLRCFYELYVEDSYYYDLLFSSIEAFEKYLYRNETLSGNRLKAYLNFCKMLKKIILYPNQVMGKRQSIHQKLLGELLEMKGIIAGGWLEEKVKALK